jgi:hypothetical protein
MSYITYQLTLARLDDLRHDAQIARRGRRPGAPITHKLLTATRRRHRLASARRHAYA